MIEIFITVSAVISCFYRFCTIKIVFFSIEEFFYFMYFLAIRAKNAYTFKIAHAKASIYLLNRSHIEIPGFYNISPKLKLRCFSVKPQRLRSILMTCIHILSVNIRENLCHFTSINLNRKKISSLIISIYISRKFSIQERYQKNQIDQEG